jgi:hypothetical protein
VYSIDRLLRQHTTNIKFRKDFDLIKSDRSNVVLAACCSSTRSNIEHVWYEPANAAAQFSHTSTVNHAGFIFAVEHTGSALAVRQARLISSNDTENRIQYLSSPQVANNYCATLELELNEFSIGSTAYMSSGSTSVLGMLSLDNISFDISYVRYIDWKTTALSTIIGCQPSSLHRLFLNLDVKLRLQHHGTTVLSSVCNSS